MQEVDVEGVLSESGLFSELPAACSGTSTAIQLWDFVSVEPSAILDGDDGMILCMAYKPCG